MAALLLREALETPDRTAALVAPDQALARRVAAKLARWGVIPDNSAGEALAGCPCGGAGGPGGPRRRSIRCDPVALLAILKHPYVRLGLSGARAARRWSAMACAARGPGPGRR